MYGDTDLYWRIIIAPFDADQGDMQYLSRSQQCNVATYSDVSYEEGAKAIKYNLAGVCNELVIDEEGKAVLS